MSFEQEVKKLDKKLEESLNRFDKTYNEKMENRISYLEYFLEDLVWIWEEYYYVQEERKKILAINPVSYKIKQEVNNKIIAQYKANKMAQKQTQEKLYKQLNRFIELLKKETMSDEELDELWKIEEKYHRIIYFGVVNPILEEKRGLRKWEGVVTTLRTTYFMEWIQINQELIKKLLEFEKKVYNYFEINWTKTGEMKCVIRGVANELIDVLWEGIERIPENLKDLVK